MNSKTPKFNKLLKEAYDNIRSPFESTCSESGQKYYFSQEQIEMYKKLEVPIPNVSPLISDKRQRAYIPGLELFKRDLATGQKGAITMYDPESKVVVWDNTEWYSDNFNGLNYGVTSNPDNLFFDQWKKLSWQTPRLSISNSPNNINSPWVVNAAKCQNCYFNHGGINNEELIYCDFCARVNHSIGSAGVVNSEYTFDSIQCDQSSNLFTCERCEGGLNLYFCLGCRNCSDCFGCVNLFRKKFCFFNEQLTEEEYRKKIADIDLGDRNVYQDYKQKALAIWDTSVRCAYRQFSCENVIGDDVARSNNAIANFAIYIENSYDIFDASVIKHSCNISTANNLEYCYNCTSVEESYGCKMCLTCTACSNVEYCEQCFDCEYCFGCIGLRHKKYCILNVQYTEDEYWIMLDKIKYSMLKRGEYGNFFPYASSLLAYNTTSAMFFAPSSKENIERIGGRWYDLKKNNEINDNMEISEVPLNIKDADDSILKKIFKCPQSHRTFRIIKPELDFYRQHHIYLPNYHPNVRRQLNIERLLPIYFEKFDCNQCHRESYKQIKEKDNGKLYCDVCYEDHLINNVDLKKQGRS